MLYSRFRLDMVLQDGVQTCGMEMKLFICIQVLQEVMHINNTNTSVIDIIIIIIITTIITIIIPSQASAIRAVSALLS